jgi:hypothetical protein
LSGELGGVLKDFCLGAFDGLVGIGWVAARILWVDYSAIVSGVSSWLECCLELLVCWAC